MGIYFEVEVILRVTSADHLLYHLGPAWYRVHRDVYGSGVRFAILSHIILSHIIVFTQPYHSRKSLRECSWKEIVSLAVRAATAVIVILLSRERYRRNIFISFRCVSLPEKF